jgi:hypothetical protein
MGSRPSQSTRGDTACIRNLMHRSAWFITHAIGRFARHLHGLVQHRLAPFFRSGNDGSCKRFIICSMLSPALCMAMHSRGRQVFERMGRRCRYCTSGLGRLLALSENTQSMSLLGVKRTCPVALHMSAFDPKRTSVAPFPLRFRASTMHYLDGGCGETARVHRRARAERERELAKLMRLVRFGQLEAVFGRGPIPPEVL